MADGKSFRQLIVTVSLILGAALILNFVASTVWNRCEVRRDYIYNMYESMREEKVVYMDYCRVDSPEVRRLKEQMERDRNWGWGINTPILCINDILYQICSGVAALVLTWPVLVYMIHHVTRMDDTGISRYDGLDPAALQSEDTLDKENGRLQTTAYER